MADPRAYLPPGLHEDVIRKLVLDLSLPEPATIEPLLTSAAYHTIYLVVFGADSAAALHPARTNEPDGSISLVLRVSGKHTPRIKTLNEVAAMSWVREHTSIPIPAIVRFDASEDNAIGHEYTLLERVHGVSIDTIYDSLDDAKIGNLIDQLMDYLVDLHRHKWHHAGGLSVDAASEVVPGRVLAENFWQGPEIAEYWGSAEDVDSLNVRGPYDTYTDYVRSHVQQYIRNIERHEALEWMRELIPRLESFNAYLDDNALALNETEYILTHKDLHFGNIMCDPITLQITAVLDWEFAAVLPLPLWSPGGGFLWNAKDGPEAIAERDRLFEDIFSKLCKERAPRLLSDFDVKKQMPHRAILKLLNFTRAIVEVCPRGQRIENVRKWRVTLEEALSELGV